MYIDKLYNRLYSDKDALNVFLSEVKLFADKEPSFWQRHKGKILGAAALAALAAGAYGGYKYAQNQNDELNEMTNKLTQATKDALDKSIPEENKVKYTELDKQNDVNEYINLGKVADQIDNELIPNLIQERKKLIEERDKELELADGQDEQKILDYYDQQLLKLEWRMEKLRDERSRIGTERGLLTGSIDRGDLDKYMH